MSEKNEPVVTYTKIFCEECKEDVPVEEYSDGTIHIHCRHCTGECSLCDCHLLISCFQDSAKVLLFHSQT